MDSLLETELLKFNPNTLTEVRECYGLKKNDIVQLVNVLDDWVQKQSHFVVKNYDKKYLERVIITCKGSVEIAKMRIDKICTCRTLIPDFFKDVDPKTEFANVHDTFIYAVLPKMTKNNERIIIVTCQGTNYTSKTLYDFYRYITMIIEYIKIRDYFTSFIVVVDIMDINMGHLLSEVDLGDLRQLQSVTKEGYGARTKAVHMLTSSKMIDTFITLLKQVLSKKIGDRIATHKSVEELSKYVPLDLLPIELRGKQKSVVTIANEWLETLSSKEWLEYRREMNKARTNEEFRTIDKFNENYLGMPGTFRKLTLD